MKLRGMPTANSMTARWTPLEPHAQQKAYWQSDSRFIVVPAGRRSGKSEIAKRKQVVDAMTFNSAPDGRFIFGAPTHGQAKKIFWNDCKLMIPDWAFKVSRRRSISESELIIQLCNGAIIEIIGLDKPERAEGSPIDGIVLDEYGNMKETVWSQHVRPGLLTKGRPPGRAYLIGVPEGRNHYYQTYKKAAGLKDWETFTWFSSDILPPEEVAAAREELDPLTFQQEYEGSFITFEGRCYYSFNYEIHASERLDHYYNERDGLHFCFDFNVEPGVCAIVQEIEYAGTNGHCAEEVTAVLGEVNIPKHSNTQKVCRKLIEDWKEHKGKIYLYGDATGGNRGSAQLEGSDWVIIKRELENAFPGRVYSRVPSSNPSVRSRINSLNSRLQSATGTVRVLVDPYRAPKVAEDLDGVRILKGSAGEIDKKSDESLTHVSDAFGYYIHRRFPAQERIIISKEI